MMRSIAAVCLLSMLVPMSGCRTTFAAAQTGLETYRLLVKSDGAVESATNFTYAYAEGTGTVGLSIVDLRSGDTVWEWAKNGDYSEGWQMIWDAEKKRPKVIKIAIADAKAGLAVKQPE